MSNLVFQGFDQSEKQNKQGPQETGNRVNVF